MQSSGCADDEAALVRDEHVVEDDDRVDLLEPGAERVIEVAAPEVEALAAEKAHSRRVARERERIGVRRVVGCPLEDGRGHDEDLVRKRADGGEQPRAADHDPVVVPVNDAGGERLLLLLRRADRAVRLREDERMREEQVVLAHVLVVASNVLAERRLVLAEPVRGAGHRHHRAVAVVPCPSEVAERVLGPQAHGLAAPHDVIGALGLEKRHAYAIAGERRLVGHDVAEGRIVLEIEERRVGPHDVLELRDLGDPPGVTLSLDLDLDRTLVQLVDVFLPGSRRHGRVRLPSRRCIPRRERALRSS